MTLVAMFDLSINTFTILLKL